MTKTELMAKVQALLNHMGCAEVIDIAREIQIPGTSVTERSKIVAPILKKLGYARKIGGQKAIFFDRIAGMRIPKVPLRTVFSAKPWHTESGCNVPQNWIENGQTS